MESTPRVRWTQHRIRVRTPGGTAVEADIPAIHQARLAVQWAYRLAAFLVAPDPAAESAPAWAHDLHATLEFLGAAPRDCAVEVVRRAREAREPGAVNGWVLVVEIPVGPPYAGAGCLARVA